MDQPTFKQLTGIELDCDQAERFTNVVSLSKLQLEGMLGWPLDPEDFENQYEEEGKIRSSVLCLCNEEEENLDSPDDVVGRYRVYKYFSTDTFIKIDPALEIHAVKLVKGNITYRTFETDEYFPVWKNGNPKFCTSLQIRKECLTPCNWLYACPGEYMIAVDAEWAFPNTEDEEPLTTLPLELQKVWADMVANEFEEKKDIKSESITSHSYTKFEPKTIYEIYKAVFDKYAGPTGTVRRPRIV